MIPCGMIAPVLDQYLFRQCLGLLLNAVFDEIVQDFGNYNECIRNGFIQAIVLPCCQVDPRKGAHLNEIPLIYWDI